MPFPCLWVWAQHCLWWSPGPASAWGIGSMASPHSLQTVWGNPQWHVSWAIKLRVGLPLGLRADTCRRLLPFGQPCCKLLDEHRVHAQTCSQMFALKRQNAAKHAIHQLAVAGRTASAVEQQAVSHSELPPPGPGRCVQLMPSWLIMASR